MGGSGTLMYLGDSGGILTARAADVVLKAALRHVAGEAETEETTAWTPLRAGRGREGAMFE